MAHGRHLAMIFMLRGETMLSKKARSQLLGSHQELLCPTLVQARRRRARPCIVAAGAQAPEGRLAKAAHATLSPHRTGGSRRRALC